MSNNQEIKLKDFLKLIFSLGIKKIQYLFLLFIFFSFFLFYLSQNQNKRSIELKIIFQDPKELNFLKNEFRGY